MKISLFCLCITDYYLSGEVEKGETPNGKCSFFLYLYETFCRNIFQLLHSSSTNIFSNDISDIITMFIE